MNANTTTLLLSIFIILLIYCVMYYFIYDKKVFVDDEILDKKAMILDLMKEKNNFKKEKFDMSYEDLETYKNNLIRINDFFSKLNSDYDTYKTSVQDTKHKVEEDLQNLYKLQYINHINKGNAASYNEFMKFVKPEQNPYYNQYL